MDGHAGRGLSAFVLGYLDLAMQDLHAWVITAQGRSAEAHYHRGNCWLAHGQPALARSDYQRALLITADYTAAQEALEKLAAADSKAASEPAPDATASQSPEIPLWATGTRIPDSNNGLNAVREAS